MSWLRRFALLILLLIPSLNVAESLHQQPATIAGTTWSGTDSDGDYYEFSFEADGTLNYKSPTGFWTNGNWKQVGDKIFLEMNKGYSKYKGRIHGTQIKGKARNIKGHKWKWIVDWKQGDSSVRQP